MKIVFEQILKLNVLCLMCCTACTSMNETFECGVTRVSSCQSLSETNEKLNEAKIKLNDLKTENQILTGKIVSLDAV